MLKRTLIFILAAALSVAAQNSSGTGAGSSQQDFNGRSLGLALTDPPLAVQSATVSRSGNPGNVTYYYWIVTQGIAGASSPAGPYVGYSSAATLNGTNFNNISWTAVPNAITYDLLRTTTPAAPTGACACAVATAVTSTSTTDQSSSLSSYTVSAIDPRALLITATNESAGPSRSQFVFRSNGTVLTGLSTPPNANYLGGFLYRKYVSFGSGLQIASVLGCEGDFFSGGQETQIPGSGTKTQEQCLRVLVHGRTLGETDGVRVDLVKTGKGDNVPLHGLTQDFGGFFSFGSEGSDAGRLQTTQGDPNATSGGVPMGTVAAVNGNQVTLTFSSGGTNLGEQRPLINTSRSVYSTGTIASVVGSGSPVVCTVTGAATGWSALGTGAKTDLFLNISSNDGTQNGNVKHIVPIISITDDTHLVIEYNQAELNQTCFGSLMSQSGAYNIYHGGTVVSLAAPPTGATDPNAVNLVSGGGNFQVGDSAQLALGYNYHGRGLVIALQRITGESNGGGVWVVNVGTPSYRDAYRTDGNFQSAFTFANGTLSLRGIGFDIAVPGPLLAQTDTSSSFQVVIQQLTAGLAVRRLAYNRGTDSWDLLDAPVNAGSGYKYNGAAAANHCLFGNGSAYVDTASCASFAILTSAYTNATTSFTNVTGGNTLQFAVEANTNYTVTCNILWQGSANTAGPKFQFTGPASPTAVAAAAHSPVTTSTYLDAAATAFASAMADTGTITAATNFLSVITLGLVNGANAGTVTLQAAANGAGTLTIQAGSTCTNQ